MFNCNFVSLLSIGENPAKESISPLAFDREGEGSLLFGVVPAGATFDVSASQVSKFLLNFGGIIFMGESPGCSYKPFRANENQFASVFKRLRDAAA